MKKYIIFYLLFFIGCEIKSKPLKELNNKTTQNILKYADIKTENNIQKLVSEIELSDCVYGNGVGMNGEENRVYDCYDRLLQIAPDSLWFNLSHNKSPVVRVYAYKTLLNKKDPKLPLVKNFLKKDTSTVCWSSNDINIKCSISYLISILK